MANITRADEACLAVLAAARIGGPDLEAAKQAARNLGIETWVVEKMAQPPFGGAAAPGRARHQLR